MCSSSANAQPLTRAHVQVKKAMTWALSMDKHVAGQVGLVGWGFGANAVLATAVHHPTLFDAAVAYTPDIASGMVAQFTEGVSSAPALDA
jgi:dienelactone hydrolase